MNNVWITPVTFLLFTGAVALLTYLITRRDERRTNEGYFLAGRSLTYPFIAASLLLTNLSTEQMVGLNGDAFSYGLSVMAWEVVAVVALVAMALFFLPRFLKSGIATVPQYLELRFDKHTGSIANLIFLFAYMLILLPIVLYTGSKGLLSIFGVKSLFGITSELGMLYLIVILIGVVGSIYALCGGLRTLAVADLLNGIGLLIGGFMIVYFALRYAGAGEGMFAGLEKVRSYEPAMFNSLGGQHDGVPFTTLLSGVLIINVFYWCTNQQIIQRTLGAKSLAEGQKGVLLTGALKLFGPFYLVLPGIIAAVMFAGENLKSDLAYGALVNRVLPGPLAGFFAAALLGAILSSFNSALNSTCTLFSLGIYKPLIHPEADDARVVRSGRWFGWIITLIAMITAPLLAETGGIFSYLQKMNGIYFIPILAVVAAGMLFHRVPAAAAKTALVGGVVIIALCYFVPPFNGLLSLMREYHFLGLVFVALMAMMYVWGQVRGLETPFVQPDARVIEMTPYRYLWPVSLALLVVVVAIYIFFADFS